MRNDITQTLQDLRYLEWSKVRKSSGTAGSFLKSREIIDGRNVYYKLSCYDSVNGITGSECVYETVTDRLLDILNIEHLHYRLIHAVISLNGNEIETWLSASDDFKLPGESKMAFEDYYELKRNKGEDPIAFLEHCGWRDQKDSMLLVDYLILNRDRHGANIEVIKRKNPSEVRLAPLFDHGVSLFCTCRGDEEIRSFDVMLDRPVQSFVGSRSAEENLSLITPGFIDRIRPLEERDRQIILDGLENVVSGTHSDRIWEMIWGRWKRFENICDKG